MKDYHLLSSHKEPNRKTVLLYMTYISKEEEKLLDANKQLDVIRGNQNFSINLNNTYCYGQVDFNTGSDDMYDIEDFDFLDYLTGFSGIHIRNGYNYKEHTCTSTERRCGWTETWNPAIVAQFAHGCLGKPERIVLFRKVI